MIDEFCITFRALSESDIPHRPNGQKRLKTPPKNSENFNTGWEKIRKYEGFFVDHVLNGEGQITCEDGYQSKGFFKDGMLNGQGSEIWQDGTNQKGEYKDGQLNGKGEINFANGSKEWHRIDIIDKDNDYFNWDNEYDICKQIAKQLKIDFFRIDFFYSKKEDKFYANEMAFKPSTLLHHSIENYIMDRWKEASNN